MNANAPETAADAPPLTLEERVAALLMLALFLITLANVLTRYFTDISLAFTEELSIFGLVLLAFCGGAAAFVHGHHLAIGFVVERLPRRAAQVTRVLTGLASVTVFAVLAWTGAQMAWDDWQTGIASPGLGAPQWLYSLWLPVLSLLIVARIVHTAWRQRSR